MWIIFENTQQGTRSKDLLRLLISFEVPKRVGKYNSAFAAEVSDWQCIIHVLKKHIHYVHEYLGENTTFKTSDSLSPSFHVRPVEGRAEA